MATERQVFPIQLAKKEALKSVEIIKNLISPDHLKTNFILAMRLQALADVHREDENNEEAFKLYKHAR